MSPLSQFFKQSLREPEIVPLMAILGVAFASAGYVGLHQAKAPDVVWNHKQNPEPWQQVKQGDQVKLAAFNQKYDEKFTRKEW